MGQLEDLQKQVEALQGRLSKLEGDSTTFVAIVQDKSGSMWGLQEPTVSGFNEYVQDLQRRAKEDAVKYRLTVTQFDTSVTMLYENADLAKVEPMTAAQYTPMGGTALLDAVGLAINTIDSKMGSNDKALVMIMTDGFENSSHEFSRDQIKDLIAAKEETNNWTFVYMGAGIDAFTGGTSIGVHGGNTYSYAKNAASTGVTFRNVSVGTHSHALAGGATTDSFTSDHLSVDPVTTTGTSGTPTTVIWTSVVDKDKEDDGNAGTPA